MEGITDYYKESPNPAMAKTGTEYLTATADAPGKCTATAHLHEFIEFLYITDGRFDIFADDDKLCVEAGDLVLFRSNTIHRVYSAAEGNNRYVVAKIKPSVLLEFADPDHGATYVMRFVLKRKNEKTVWKKSELCGSPILECVNMLICEISGTLPAQDVAVKTAMVSLLVAILRDDAERGASSLYSTGSLSVAHQIYKSINYINKNYAKNITAADCALSVNMSYSYFSRTFKEVTGTGFKAYLNEVRINHAEHEILQTDKSITEVAFECGFNDVSYFIAQYKAAKGCTPHQFRRKHL